MAGRPKLSAQSPSESDRTGGRDSGGFLDLDRGGREHHRLFRQDRIRTGLFYRTNPVGRRRTLCSAHPHQCHLWRHRLHSRSGLYFRQPVHCLPSSDPGGLRQALDTARDALIPTGVAASQCPDQPAHRSERRVLDERRGSIQPGELTASCSRGSGSISRSNARTVPKDPQNYTVLGTSVPRIDLPAKATGQFQYVQHVRAAGHAARQGRPAAGCGRQGGQCRQRFCGGSSRQRPGRGQERLRRRGRRYGMARHASGEGVGCDVVRRRRSARPDSLYAWMQRAALGGFVYGGLRRYGPDAQAGSQQVTPVSVSVSRCTDPWRAPALSPMCRGSGAGATPRSGRPRREFIRNATAVAMVLGIAQGQCARHLRRGIGMLRVERQLTR